MTIKAAVSEILEKPDRYHLGSGFSLSGKYIIEEGGVINAYNLLLFL